MKQHIVCIGSSAASLSCAAQVRRLDKNIRVTILTSQSELPNNTCLLADYVAGHRRKESLYLPIPQNVDIHYNSEVISLDAQTKKVITRVGQEYLYDKIFIGTGLKARVPDIFIHELYKKVFPFKSLDDLVLFEQQQIAGKNVLVVGGGITGIEASYALKISGYNVTLVEKNARLLPMFNQELTQEIHELLQTQSIHVRVNCQIPNDVLHEFDIIFLATGGVPATDFLQDQICLENGFIEVNEQQQTSQCDIYAGGDCVKGRSLWPQALRDGSIAAQTIFQSKINLSKTVGFKTTIHIFGKSFSLIHNEEMVI